MFLISISIYQICQNLSSYQPSSLLGLSSSGSNKFWCDWKFLFAHIILSIMRSPRQSGDIPQLPCYRGLKNILHPWENSFRYCSINCTLNLWIHPVYQTVHLLWVTQVHFTCQTFYISWKVCIIPIGWHISNLGLLGWISSHRPGTFIIIPV